VMSFTINRAGRTPVELVAFLEACGQQARKLISTTGGSITSPSLPRRIPPVVVAFPTVAGAEPAERDTAPVAARASQTVIPT
jgi:hypothetical protein